jgi:hypothetical protein
MSRVSHHRIGSALNWRAMATATSAGTLSHDESRGEQPMVGQRQQGHGEQVDGVAGDHDRPVPAAPVAEIAGREAQAIAQQLAGAGDDPDHRGAGPEHRQERPADAPGALIGYIGEQADRADQKDELVSLSARQRQISIREGPDVVHLSSARGLVPGPHQNPAFWQAKMHDPNRTW